ncbi:Allophanate hydrolase [hydrothermal vent metagenome]|uniref:Allophanate hydrolase n=1 Tax=hydrothermal vent metagenome TaxID=652676 RepID=A0A3B1AGW9_9ZZZZ
MNFSISTLRKAYCDNEITPRELIDSILKRCEKHLEHNIWIRRLSAEELEPYLKKLEMSRLEDLPLYGIPFAIKDNIDLQDIPTTAACPDYEYLPKQSAYVVQELINAGAIPIGKTNMDQFATGLVGVRSPEPWGPCRNAFNKDYISGGSSSGSAVAVSLGLVSFSLGTDTAGSGRVPAALNNIIGLKPTKGLISMQGVVPACRSLDCVSIFALTAKDANDVLTVAASYDEQDQYASECEYKNNHRHFGNVEQEFIFALPEQNQLEFFGDASAETLFEENIKELEKLGGIKREIDFSCFLEAARLLYEGPWVAERYVAIEDLINNDSNSLLPVINTIIGGGRDKMASDAFKAEYKMQTFRQQAQKIFRDIDFLVTPTVGTSYKIKTVQNDPIKLNSNLGYYTNYMNLLDCCGIAIPSGKLENGLPFGITLSQLAQSDRKLLSYANRFQQAWSLAVGAKNLPITDVLSDQESLPIIRSSERIPLVVCGAHLQGLALNWQLVERGACLEFKTTTSQNYRFYALAGGPPERPGLIRDNKNGFEIEVEVWAIPTKELGSFVAGIPAPLGIGKVELKNGDWLSGFICEGYAITNAQEISQLKSWRKYIQNK